jgi:hypothetical protein
MKQPGWRKWFLKYFDWNDDGITNWWEWFIPIVLIIGVEVLAEIIARILI